MELAYQYSSDLMKGCVHARFILKQLD